VRLVFIDFIEWDYTPETPWEKPLGGTQSGACYLMAALASSGHDVFLLNNTRSVGRYRGVQCVPMVTETELLKELFALLAPDVVVVLSSSSSGYQLRPLLPSETRLYLWTGHAVDQPHHEALTEEKIRTAWDGFIFMGTWQLETVCERYGLSPSRAVSLGMGIAPVFESLFEEGDSILRWKRERPVLAYTSTPFRGLELLLDCFPEIYKRIPEVELRVYSSMKIYQVEEGEDRFGGLYKRCRDMPGVVYVGPQPQHKLAKELKEAAVLAYPNTFEETACVAMMEAMASGCAVVSSNLGALPETNAGFGRLLGEAPKSPEYKYSFIEAVVASVEEVMNDPEDKMESLIRAQVDYCNQTYGWTKRSREWVRWLERER